ncbi:CRAL/TRIO domain-containing protein [Ceraceosorus guamensis]|uniref:CRAL/TRIO domain-containing protein n=1 Tax=Ceraceosorus guamensis TaxID=1522189 RepID=A0A316VRW8_9BASI|nr:CRAL/TRIO domain-containing protein [Ceraceosorus guamensis]PWN39153.1 CRAL/TRIO domain-containing protein [Ceraceosorus guamensis]
MSRFLRRAPAPSTSVDKSSLPVSHDPILAPLPSTLASLQSRPPSAPLSAAQQDLLAALGAYVWELHGRGWEDDAELSKSRTVTETAGSSIEPAHKAKESASAASTSTSPAPAWYRTWEETFLKDATTLPRYARASKWDLENAKKRISETLYWRRSYRPELISPDEVVEEAKTGKQVLSGFDKDGRPVLYLRPGRENTTPSPRQIRFLVYALERSLDIAPEGVETLTIIIDYKSATQASNPSLSQALKVLNILQAHYVERMGRAFVCNVPWYLNAFFSAISPFLDPATRAKIRFNAKLEEFVDLDLLDAEFGGRHRYVWDFEKVSVGALSIDD